MGHGGMGREDLGGLGEHWHYWWTLLGGHWGYWCPPAPSQRCPPPQPRPAPSPALTSSQTALTPLRVVSDRGRGLASKGRGGSRGGVTAGPVCEGVGLVPRGRGQLWGGALPAVCGGGVSLGVWPHPRWVWLSGWSWLEGAGLLPLPAAVDGMGRGLVGGASPGGGVCGVGGVASHRGWNLSPLAVMESLPSGWSILQGRGLPWWVGPALWVWSVGRGLSR